MLQPVELTAGPTRLVRQGRRSTVPMAAVSSDPTKGTSPRVLTGGSRAAQLLAIQKPPLATGADPPAPAARLTQQMDQR
jgi:hypothetical protein